MKNLTVTVEAVGNPDYSFNDYRRNVTIKEKTIQINTITEASKICRDFINEHELGGGNWSGGKILSNGEQIGRVSYNGRIWDMNDDLMFEYSRKE